MRLLAGIAFLMGIPGAALAQQDAGSPWIETRYHRVHLRNGNTIDGQLVNDGKNSVVLKLKVGEMQIRRDMIDHVEMVRMRSLKEAPEVLPKAAPVPAPRPDGAEPGPKPAPGQTAAQLAADVPVQVRNDVEGIIHAWIAAPSGQRGDLAQQLEPLTPESARYLCALLDERPRRVPAGPLCQVLSRRPDPSLVPSIGRLLQPGNALNDREAAATALAEMAISESAPFLLQALNDPSNTVWRAASRGLIALDKKFPNARLADTVVAAMDASKEKGAYALTLGGLEGEDSYRALTYLLRGDEREQVAGLQGISRRLNPQDGELIMPLLQSPSRLVRQQACGVLGRAKYKPAVSDLIAMLREEDVGLMADAHRALQEITGQNLARDYNLWNAWWEGGGKTLFPR